MEGREHRGQDRRRRALSAALEDSLGGSDSVSLLITGEAGSGKSTLLNRVVSSLPPREAVRRVIASHALRSVPYGALAPHLRSSGPLPALDPVSVLRAVWADLGSHSAEGRGVVVVVDDAHDLDEASAGILAEIAASSQLRLLAAAQTHPGLPHALLKLWNDGMAEHHELEPFSVEETAEAAEQRLGGRLSRLAAAVLQRISGGNPHLLARLLEEASSGGGIVAEDGVWVLRPSFESTGAALAETIGAELDVLAPRERDAVVLVALAEPLAEAGVLDADVVARLVETGWLRQTADGLRVAQPMRADAICHVTTASRKLQMRERIALHAVPAGLHWLRRLELDLDCGVHVPDEVIARGLAEALAGGRPGLALTFGRFLRSPAERFRLRVGIARALHDLGDTSVAIEVLEQKPDQAASPGALLSGSLLLAHLRLAFRQDGSIAGDLGRLRARAALLAARGQADPALLESVEEHCALVDALCAADRGDYGVVDSLLAEAGGRDAPGARPADTAPTLAGREGLPGQRATGQLLRKLLDAESRFAEGRFAAAAETSTALLGATDADGEFLPIAESAFALRLLAGLHCGGWDLGDEELGHALEARSRSAVARGPALLCGRAYGLVRRGRFGDAAALLPEAVASLRVHDPHQLLGVATALAAVAAAAVGDERRAVAWLAEAESAAGRGNHVRRVLAELHRAVARHRLGEPHALSGLHATARREGGAGLPGLELVAEILALELGDTAPAQRVVELIPAAEGAWAHAWGAWARSVLDASAGSYLEAGQALVRLGLPRQARSAYARAAQALDRDGDRVAARRAGSLARQCAADGGQGLPVSPEEQFLTAQQLTAREHGIVLLALEGLADRDIAERLSISVRTVEGHLHRSYVKLGVRGRDELPEAVLD
ncbi:helix-turn-helix transcriptional regulator [Sinomonas mesophila]|uniref:helix-turn-helix transcriptional regulator n=1 Tax=Sinomonas mesophila TaxID=1531955 RepID=UPI0009857A4E|nr:LuxR family transcriptional regulator [Sinomonas mesophila]